jgi:hypothetical protein
VTAVDHPVAATPEALLSSYEDLRRTAVGPGDGSGHGLGLALFIRSGMAFWMQTCACFVRPREATPRQEEPHRPSLRPDLQNEVAMVLAEMALSAHTTQGEMTS